MKKFTFSSVLVFLTAFLFAQTAADYDKILRGDLSAVAGTYVNGNNKSIVLQPNGSIRDAYGESYAYSGFRKDARNCYYWSMGYVDPPIGYMVTLYPVGVDVFGYDTATYSTGFLKTDTTRVRLHTGHDVPDNPNEIYYREAAVFSSNLIGTWKRDNFNNTLTFSTNRIQANNQNYYWTLQSVSDNKYTIRGSLHGGTITITIRLTNDSFEISGDSGSGQDNWNGVWKKQ